MADNTKKAERKAVRGMPNNVEAEECVLGAMLIDDKAADTIMPMLHADDFYVPANRIIFAVMRDLQEHSKPIDTVSVADKLEKDGKLDEIGSIAYLSSLAENLPSAANAKYYAELIKRDSLSRKVINAGNEIVEFTYESGEGAESLAKAEQLIFRISEEESDKALVPAKVALTVALQNIMDAQSGNIPNDYVFTGFKRFDSMTKGLKPGEFIILAARPSVGKTALALNIAANVVLTGKTVAVFNMEMTADSLVKRMLAYVSGVTFDSMDVRGQLSDADSGKLLDAYNKLLGSSLYIDDYSMNHPSDILSKCRRLKREHGLDLVIVDYLQLMEAESRGRASESRQNDVSMMSRQLKVYAKELGVPIIALSQMSRGVEKEGGRLPQLSDLRDSGAIEQDADVVMFLHDPSKADENLPKDEITLIIRKNRSGAVGEIKLNWRGETTTFREMTLDGTVEIPENASPSEPIKTTQVLDTPAEMPFEPTAEPVEPDDDDDEEYVDEFTEVDSSEEDLPF